MLGFGSSQLDQKEIQAEQQPKMRPNSKRRRLDSCENNDGLGVHKNNEDEGEGEEEEEEEVMEVRRKKARDGNGKRDDAVVDWLVGGGEMGKLVRSKDWSKTPLGPVHSWPQSLRTTVSLVLSSNFPISLAWGPHHIQIYNDGYWPICGSKHPESMGQPFPECWAAPWPIVGPPFEDALKGKTAFIENSRMFLFRHGFLEETFFTFSFSPIHDESGGIGGLFHPVTEVTCKLLTERRTLALQALAAVTGKTQSTPEALLLASKAMADYQYDLPFTLLYLIDSNTTSNETTLTAKLMGHTGLQLNNTSAGPEWVTLASSTVGDSSPSSSSSSSSSSYSTPWSSIFNEVYQKREMMAVENLEVLFGPFYCGPYPEPMNKALVIPILLGGNDGPVAIFVAGVSTRLALNGEYRSFYGLVATSITATLSNAKAHEEERARAEALAALDRAKTEFFSNISHEFRTPLMLMLGPLEESLDDRNDPLSESQVIRQEMIQRNAMRLLKLVNSLLDFSRVEANRIQRQFQPTDLPKLTTDLAVMFQPAIEMAKLTFKTNIAPMEEPVYVDREMWEKIVFNLLSNAFKFTLKGEIEVGLVKREKCVKFYVRDTGVGVPANEVPHLFDRFHRAKGTQGRSFEGSGIGLALTQQLVKLHEGTVEAFSQLGVGTTFVIRIPLGKAHLPPECVLESEKSLLASGMSGQHYLKEALSWIPNPEETARVESVPNSPATREVVAWKDEETPSGALVGVRILLVDDNVDMRKYIKGLMQPSWKVTERENGFDALETLRSNGEKPDLILTDVMMPKMDGFQLLACIRADPTTRSIPVIMISARAGEEAKVEGIEAGADDYLVKPFAKKELQARVKSQLELGRLRATLEQRVRKRTEELSKTNDSLRSEIEKHRETQEELRKSETAYKDLVSVVPVGIFKVGRDNKVQYTNHFLRNLAGSHVELEGKDWIDLVHPTDRQRVLEARSESRNGKPFACEFRLNSIKMAPSWVILQLSAYEEGRTGQSQTGALIEITERKLLEENRLEIAKESERRAQLQAEESAKYQQKLKEFIDITCHEIRNPINGILGSIDIIRDTLFAAQNLTTSETAQKRDEGPIKAVLKEIATGIESIQECVEHQTVITNDVLDLTKLESNQITCVDITFDLTSALRQVSRMFHHSIEKKMLKLHLNVPEDPIFVRGDEHKLKRVMIHLLSNAMKFTNSGSISVSLVQESITMAGLVNFLVVVEDTGSGMSEEEQAGIFETHESGTETCPRGGRKLSYDYGGSGLGLVISQHLMELMGSRIQVESKKNAGSKFSFRIQLPSADPPTTPSPRGLPGAKLANAAVLHQKKILIVEDNPINRKVLSVTLERNGCRCDFAFDGSQCLKKVATETFDLILMDIEMPVMNGFEATRAVRLRETELGLKSTPIVCLTGNARGEYRQLALEAGMNDFVTKPFKREELVEKLSKLLSPSVLI